MNFIDLFSGAGGLSEGFINAGFTPIAHVESDKAACFTLKTRLAFHYLSSNNQRGIYNSYMRGEISRNTLYETIPKALLGSVINKFISKENNAAIFNTVDAILQENMIEEVDLIIGGPPCQAYSNIGRAALKHIEDDPRKKLYVEYGKFIEHYRPKLFIFENVPGLKSSDHGIHYENIKKTFREIGYIVDDRLLNALDFGVIQNRRRLIIMGWREDVDFNYPSFDLTEMTYTSQSLFQDLPYLRPGEGSRWTEYTQPVNEYLLQSGIRDNDDILTLHITRPHNKKDLNIYRLAIEKYDEGILLTNDTIPENQRTQKNTKDFLDRFKVVGTIPHTIIAHIAKDGHHFIYNDLDQIRSISVREAARIQSFPDNYYFEGEREIGSRTAAFKQIGNAVPPLMANKIANKIKQLLDE
ncbi:DNA cytosine methyltransferase [Bacteroidales bacterium OttesenSCG-928-I14]|nr:DNA cytosine methyltransferase [Bacteroidales bacterium OttesenSCG-928-I14]